MTKGLSLSSMYQKLRQMGKINDLVNLGLLKGKSKATLQ